MEIKRPGRRKLMGEINVVPFIDIMLVLLVVFMVTTPLITQGVKIDLPKVDSETVQEEENKQTLVVSINGEGKYFISLGDVPEEDPPEVPLDQIRDQVSKIMNQNPSVPVYLEADGANDYSVVMELMATLQAAGVPNVLLVTQPPGAEAN
jgi:biopolymer transport protein TolR